MSEIRWCSHTYCNQRKHGSCAQVQCIPHAEVLHWLQIERAGDTRHSLREEAAAVLAAVLQASMHLQTAQSCMFALMVRQPFQPIVHHVASAAIHDSIIWQAGFVHWADTVCGRALGERPWMPSGKRQLVLCNLRRLLMHASMLKLVGLAAALPRRQRSWRHCLSVHPGCSC